MDDRVAAKSSFGAGAKATVVAAVLLEVELVFAVKQFANGHGLIAIFGEALRQGIQFVQSGRGIQVGTKKIDATAMGITAGHQTGARGIADGRLAMGVAEERAAFGKTIDIGR